MPSKESLERAQELVAQYVKQNPFAEIRIGNPFDFYARLADLLDEAIREARVGEAACWYTNWNVDDSIRSFGKWAEARLAQLREGKT